MGKQKPRKCQKNFKRNQSQKPANLYFIFYNFFAKFRLQISIYFKLPTKELV